jgi:hypothetical protein
MSETNADINYVTKQKFLLVVVSLVGLLMAALALLGWRIFFFRNPLPPPSTPIVVRGGSMTAYTTNAGAAVWEQAGSGYCAVVDTSEIAFIEVNESKIDKTSSLAPGWEIDIFGHDPGKHNGNPSRNYFQIISKTGGCPKMAGNTSVWISVISSSGKAGFYPAASLPVEGKFHTSAVRFLDQSTMCVGGDAAGNNDQDYCERMARVEVKLAPGVSGTPPGPYTCMDGDCSVVIGDPK